MDEGDDEDAVVAQQVDDAPGVSGDLAQVRVIDFRDLAAGAGAALLGHLRMVNCPAAAASMLQPDTEVHTSVHG